MSGATSRWCRNASGLRWLVVVVAVLLLGPTSFAATVAAARPDGTAPV